LQCINKNRPKKGEGGDQPQENKEASIDPINIMKTRELAILHATQRGYLNQAILFNAGFTFIEVQEIKQKENFN
jgi:hypothetical protein